MVYQFVHKFLKMKELGKVVTDMNLNSSVPENVIEQIKNDVHKHKLVIFKKQSVISGDRQVEISKWFGNLESTFYKHPRSPHPDVFRVSNDEDEGCTHVGRTGWHIDGSFMRKPFGYSLYYMFSVPLKGDTAFIPLNDLFNSLSPEVAARWERLWMVSDRRDGVVHPLIYPHPITGLKTLCLHLGMSTAFIWDLGSEKERMTERSETVKIIKEIYQEIVKDDGRLIYSHKWEEGDFIISDNLAVGHEASEETQYSKDEVGLRILHRTTIEGKHEPHK
ncbi:alpha-ketoglutarate-dependent taurine dioxygenase-like [Mytilus trossulus]|uniref:alpha-ketoglutarate-dependent taurine dioxygenase-like n=1 Tax=Mytilus trossulus TaxID=6551 RepID=UPI003007B420